MQFETRIEQLKKALQTHDGAFAARVAAMVVYKGRVVSIGLNQDKTHPFASRFSKHPEAIFLHAEHDAILKAIFKIGEEGLKKATLIVCRVITDEARKKVYYANARPCDGCYAAIKNYGIRRVVFTKKSDVDQMNYEVILPKND